MVFMLFGTTEESKHWMNRDPEGIILSLFVESAFLISFFAVEV